MDCSEVTVSFAFSDSVLMTKRKLTSLARECSLVPYFIRFRGKKWLKIHDYSPIMSDYTSLIGNPQTYTGKIEDRAQSNTTENGHGEKRGAPPKNESPSYEPSPKRHSHPSAIHPPGQPVTPIDLLTPYVNK